MSGSNICRLVILLNIFASVISQDITFPDQVDDVVCETDNRVVGFCQRLQTCPEIMQDIRVGKKVTHCTFEGKVPIVCCPLNTGLGLIEEKARITDLKVINSPEINFKCGLRNFEPPQAPRHVASRADNGLDVFLVRAFVAGGAEAPRNSWPWMVLLGRRQGPSNNFFCSGMLINPNYVITAAHCVLEIQPFFVRLGEHDYTGNISPETYEDVGVVNITFHPEYDVFKGYYDIALIKLNTSVRFRNEVRPICLPWGTEITENLVGESVTIAGWGIEGFGQLASTNLQEVNVTVFHPSTCEESYSTLNDFEEKFPIGMTLENIVCAGDVDGGKDACEGDSGGPMMHFNSTTDTYSLAGIISKGFGCGKVDFPGLYAPIRNHDTLLWIKNTAFP